MSVTVVGIYFCIVDNFVDNFLYNYLLYNSRIFAVLSARVYKYTISHLKRKFDVIFVVSRLEII